jgi:hypothetical protein
VNTSYLSTLEGKLYKLIEWKDSRWTKLLVILDFYSWGELALEGTSLQSCNGTRAGGSATTVPSSFLSFAAFTAH